MAKKMIEVSSKPTIRALVSLPNADGGYTNVLKEADGNVTVLDKIKGYYKALYALVGTLLMILTNATPIFSFLPIDDKYLTIIIGFLTTLSVLMKRNQTWVDEL